MSRLAQKREGVKWRLYAMRRLWASGAERHAPFIPPPPPPPPPPYQGNLDGPHHQPGKAPPDPPAPTDPEAPAPPPPPVEVDDEILRVRGWATFVAGPTTKVEVFLDGEPLGNARIGVHRTDVVAAMPEEPYVEVAGFELDLATAPLCPDGERKGEITAIAFGPTGERQELGPLPVLLRVPDDEDEEAAEVAPTTVPTAFAGHPGRRALVVTHQLTLGGAQLLLMDLIREQMALGLVDPIVVSTMDGPLRKELEALGVPVHVTSLIPPDNMASQRGRLEEFLTWARPLNAELVLVNTSTSTTFVGGEIAVALGVPSVWLIHESFEPAFLWADISPVAREHAEATIGTATSAVFEADATRRIYEGLIDPGRCHTVPYGLDLKPIDELRANFDRDAARRKVGVPVDAKLVVCIGTVEPRKAQVPLAIAFDLIGAKHPDSRLAFVGGKPGAQFTVALEDCIAASPRREQMEVIPITPDVADWYGMADLLVCASDVESLPRTVLEAMAWGTPVLATSVFGIPELIEDGKTGWLCEPRDSRALADALDRALDADEATYAAIARDARTLVEKRHGLKHYAEEMARRYEAAIGSSINR